VWDCCKVGGVNVTVGLDCESGKELQLDWLELSETPLGEAGQADRVLIGAAERLSTTRPALPIRLDRVDRDIGVMLR